MSRYNLYFNDILRAINRIEKSVKDKSLEEFSSDENLIDATAMRLQIIGESLKKIPSNLKENKEINWKSLEKLRDLISHAYFQVNPALLFSIINNNLIKLKIEIKEKIK